MSSFTHSFNSLLQACKTLNQAKQLHHRILLTDSHHNPFFVTKLIQIYADSNDLRSALVLLHIQLSHPNVFAFTSILSFHSRHGSPHRFIQTYVELRQNSVVPDGYVFPKVLKACAQLLGYGRVVHTDVIVFRSESNLQVRNSVLDMYSKCGDVGSAKQVFDEMSERDVFSWNSMMSGYVCNGLPHKAVEVLGVMKLDGCGCEPDVVMWNTLMDAYCRMGKYCEASRVFGEIKDPNVISWTILISGYAGVGRHDVSLGIFREMVNVGMVSPDVDALSGVLVSCRHLGDLASGMKIHGYGLKVMCGDVFYRSAGAALLTLYAGCGRLDRADNVFRRMDKSDVVTWNAMIFGLVDAGLGNLALECFREMQGR